KILNIIIQIIVALKCLYDNGYCYTDIKLENILYRCISENEFKIILGDLGSAVKIGEHSVATFPRPTNTDGQISGAKQEDVVWGTGILMLQLIGIDVVNTIRFDKNYNLQLLVTKINE